MKKYLFVIIAAISFSSASFAQIATFKGWTLKMGTNYSTIDDKDTDLKYSYKFGFTAGVNAEWYFTDIWGVSVDLLYSRQGGTVDLNKMIKGAKITESSNYLNVPIMGNVYLTEKLTFKTGVQLGWFLSGDETITGTEEPLKADLLSAYKSIDLAIPVGLSYEFDFGLVIDARYHFGLSNIVKESPNFPDYKAKNSYASLTLGYRFKFDK